MPINKLVEYCHKQYSLKTSQCEDCQNKASDSCKDKYCGSCFSKIFFNSDSNRTYNCECITYSYVCRFIYQYSSEIIHLLKLYKVFFEKDKKINTMSIGCGPCSELFAIDILKKEFNFAGDISYIGFDTNRIWNNVQNKVKPLIPFPVEIFTEDCFQHIEQNTNFTYPNLLIMNYLLSDISKYGDLPQFIDNVVEKIIDKMPNKSLIIINDINNQTPRDNYDTLIQKINDNNNIAYEKWRFSRAFGDNLHVDNDINDCCHSLKGIKFNRLTKIYGTKNICTSAQLIIAKKSNK